MKSLIVLIFLAISAYMTLKGVFAPPRANGARSAALRRRGARRGDLRPAARSSARSALGAAAKLWIPFVVAAAIGGLRVRRAANSARRARWSSAASSSALVIVGGWYVSGHLGFVAGGSGHARGEVRRDELRTHGVVFSYTAPVAYLLELLMLVDRPVARCVTFGIAGVLGMLVGSAAMAIATKTFRWEGFTNREDLANHIVGGILMGFGGVTALGCTIGQGLTGISTLAIGSFLAFWRDRRGLRRGGHATRYGASRRLRRPDVNIGARDR